MIFVVLAAIVEKKIKYLKKLLGSDPAVAEISLLSCSFIFKFSIVLSRYPFLCQVILNSGVE